VAALEGLDPDGLLNYISQEEAGDKGGVDAEDPPTDSTGHRVTFAEDFETTGTGGTVKPDTPGPSLAASAGKQLMTMDRMMAELSWQGTQEGNKEERDGLRDTVLNTADLITFVIMKPDSAHLQVIHSLGKFIGDVVERDEYHGQIIGFVGDVKNNFHPIPVTIKEDQLVKWKKVKVPADATAVREHYENGGKTLFITTEGDTLELTVPNMALIPNGLVGWLTTE